MDEARAIPGSPRYAPGELTANECRDTKQTWLSIGESKRDGLISLLGKRLIENLSSSYCLQSLRFAIPASEAPHRRIYISNRELWFIWV